MASLQDEDSKPVRLASAFPSLPQIQRMISLSARWGSLLAEADGTVARIAIPCIFSVYGV
jgi:hypothetical protein